MTSLTAGKRLFDELEIDLDTIPTEQLDAYTSVEYFLILEDEPPDDVSNLEKVERYLQVFKHLSEVSAWQQASKVLLFCPEDNSKELHKQLGVWGYYREQIGLYQGILGRVSCEQDLICLYGLGKVFDNLSDFSKSFDYYEQQLKLARQVNDRHAEAWSLDGLGSMQLCQFKYLEAIASHQQQLEIAREINSQEQEGYALKRLGWTLFRQGFSQGNIQKQQAGLNYLEASLKIAYLVDNQELEVKSLNCISSIYFERGQFAQSVAALLQQLNICEKTTDRGQRHIVLGDLGRCYAVLRQYKNAQECLQEALEIARELGDLYSESLALNRLAILYGYELQKYETAIFYCEKSLEATQKCNIQNDFDTATYINLFNFYAFLNQKEKSDFYLEMAKAYAAKSDSIEEKAMVVMGLARAYWSRNQIWHKLFGLFLAAKGLMMIPPWQSANGRIALQLTIAVLTQSAQDLSIAMIQEMKNFLKLPKNKFLGSKLKSVETE